MRTRIANHEVRHYLIESAVQVISVKMYVNNEFRKAALAYVNIVTMLEAGRPVFDSRQ
jgi:hypothetical protein